MPRSIKKGPFIDQHLWNKVNSQNEAGDRRVIKTWSRRSTILPDFVGHTLAVHNGRKFIVRHGKHGGSKLGDNSDDASRSPADKSGWDWVLTV